MHRAHESFETSIKRRLCAFVCLFLSLSLTSGEMGIVTIRDSSLLLLILHLSIRQRTSAYVSLRQHKSGYVRIHQDTSGYVRIGRPPHSAPQHQSAACTVLAMLTCFHYRSVTHTHIHTHTYTRQTDTDTDTDTARQAARH